MHYLTMMNACRIGEIARLFAATWAIAFGGIAVAGEPAESEIKESLAIDFYFDNDAFSGGKDEDYTGGMALAFTGAGAARHPLSLDGALSWLNRQAGWGVPGQSDIDLRSYEIGIVAFTPDDIGAPAPIKDDRPYAGLVYASNTQQTIDFAARSSVITALSVGVLGLSAVGDLQNSVHQLTGSSRANGWQNQISDGGEPTVKYSLAKQHYFATGNPLTQATAIGGFSVGFVTEALLGGSIRVGRLRTPWWSFNVHNSNYGEKTSISVPTSKTLDEVFVVLGANVKLRAYNAFLQGQFRHSPVRYSSSEIEPLVYESWLGIGCELDSGVRLAYLLRRHSSELKGGPADRIFTYGELIASYKF